MWHQPGGDEPQFIKLSVEKAAPYFPCGYQLSTKWDLPAKAAQSTQTYEMYKSKHSSKRAVP